MISTGNYFIIIMVQKTTESNLENDPSIKYGKLLAHPSPGEEIVISGMAGKFPLANDIDEFTNKHYNKVDMISRGPVAHPEMPAGIGKLHDKELTRFDAGFFGVHRLHAITMNEMCRLLLERCVECIFDAGLHPSDLEGTKTGVFSGMCDSDSDSHWYFLEHVKNGETIVGNMKGTITNRLSYFLKLMGPSCCLDTACSSSLYALDAAYNAIRNGEIEQAIVCGSNVIIDDTRILQFARLGLLSKDGVLRAFDDNGSGYVRSEATAAVLLQKAKSAKRVYSKVVHIKVNCDGYKEEGITYPSGKDQMNLLKEVYLESGINPEDISFIEAHATGTVVGDTEELNSIDEYFSKERATPLLVGSVKSSIGHSEPVAGLCSLINASLAFETNTIPPNINYDTPRKTVPGLCEGRIKVVVEKTPLHQNGIIGVNNFGFGGANAHVVLKGHAKKKIASEPSDDLPRLVCVSGRTREAVNCLLGDIAEKFDAEHIGLIHNAFRKPVHNHLFRGYAIVSKKGLLKQSIQPFNPNRSNLHIYFGEFTRNTGNLVQELLNLPLLSKFKNRIEQFLTNKKMDLNDIISKSFSSNLDQLIAESITQICLTELFIKLEVELKGVSGLPFGEFTSAYFENSLSLEEILECIYGVGIIVEKVDIFAKYKNQILTDFQRILKYRKQCTDDDGTKMRITSPENLSEAGYDNIENLLLDLPKNSFILQIGHSLPSLKKRSFNVVNFDGNGGFQGLLEVLGCLYEHGVHPQIQKLYPEIQFPVSRGTPMISSKIKWKHDYEYFVPQFDVQKPNSEVMRFVINLNHEKFEDLGGHVIDGRNLFPSPAYLYLVWCLMGEVLDIELNQLKITFENCKFKRACTIPNKDTSSNLELSVMVQEASGNFEISEANVPVVTGRVKVAEQASELNLCSPIGNWASNNDVLLNKDIYKELRLRGYNYSGLFQGLTQCDKTVTFGKIRWSDNWIAFLNCMQQMKFLKKDTRLLYIPISIARLTINPSAHMELVEKLKSEISHELIDIPVECSSVTGIIRSGGIEIRGMQICSISRKRCASPVLEKYQFIPNQAKLSLEQSVRVIMQVALENNSGLEIKVAEIINDASECNVKILGPIIEDVMELEPLVHVDVTVFSSTSDSRYTVIVGSELLSKKEVLQEAIKGTVDSGFILSREPLSTNTSGIILDNLHILNILETNEENLVFLRKQPKSISVKRKVFINVSTKDKSFGWLSELKEAIRKNYDVIVWCQNEPINGIIGLVKCLRKEPDCQDVRSFFIVDQAPDFDPTNPFYKKQLEKNMGFNVFSNGHWGTYRHLLLDNLKEVENEHCYANNTASGDLSSIRWLEGPLRRNSQLKSNETLVDVYYSSINFRDILTVKGGINVDVVTSDRREQECVQGIEFSGKTKNGRRVMGIVAQRALATLVKADTSLLWEVPKNWSLKEAATVPVVYGTCLYALVVVGKIKPSDSVLIHSGTGGIGQAAINLCLNIGCTVFTTVGTNEKREFIQKHFPKIDERHIGNSRDICFEQMIMKETCGRGVDIVLNALADEKLIASVRCLAENGRFLEIGKFDLAYNSYLNLMPLRHGASYHGIMMERVFNDSARVKELNILLQKHIDSGAIKPLMANVFEKNEIAQAFKFMTTRKHIGKVLIEIRKENENYKNLELRFTGLPRYYCDAEKSYIICGGLGGFGLELADWLVLRGARNLILTSRKGITTGYQSYRISIWKSYSCNVKISTQDITSQFGCVELIKEAEDLGPVHAIFNLAIVLSDAILENQTEQSFTTSFEPKAYATEYLDQISRKMCPELRDFVVFSSVSSGRGNAGQTNYGMSNSVMEMICEKRRKEGYPALTIEWGAIGDVGLVGELQGYEVGGTVQQRISSCIQAIDVLLRQNESSVVSSMVLAEKRIVSTSGNIEEVICAILGIRDIKLVSMFSTLAELGMDSINGIEVKHTLEREYGIFLSRSQLRSITLTGIKDLHEEQSTRKLGDAQQFESIFNWLEYVINHKESGGWESSVCRFRSKSNGEDIKNLPKIIALPGVEGYCDLLQDLMQNLEVDAYGINYCPSKQTESIPEMSDVLLSGIQDLLHFDKSFHLIAHSFGSVVALEIASRLENLGYLGTVTLLDGSPSFMKKLANNVILDGDSSDAGFENSFLLTCLAFKLDDSDLEATRNDINKCSNFQEKFRFMVSKCNSDEIAADDELFDYTVAVKKRFAACLNYTPSYTTLKSKIRLFKPTILNINMESDDYDLGQYCEQPVEVKIFEGTHKTFLENEKLTEAIMDLSSDQ